MELTEHANAVAGALDQIIGPGIIVDIVSHRFYTHYLWVPTNTTDFPAYTHQIIVPLGNELAARFGYQRHVTWQLERDSPGEPPSIRVRIERKVSDGP